MEIHKDKNDKKIKGLSEKEKAKGRCVILMFNYNYFFVFFNISINIYCRRIIWLSASLVVYVLF